MRLEFVVVGGRGGRVRGCGWRSCLNIQCDIDGNILGACRRLRGLLLQDIATLGAPTLSGRRLGVKMYPNLSTHLFKHCFSPFLWSSWVLRPSPSSFVYVFPQRFLGNKWSFSRWECSISTGVCHSQCDTILFKSVISTRWQLEELQVAKINKYIF